MLMDSQNRKIYIFAGQRAKECLTDLYCYSINQDKVTEIAQDFSKKFGSESAGYTQRAAIDIDRQEICISSGFLKNKPTKVVRNCFWVYNIIHNTWEEVYESDNHDTSYWNRMKEVQPVPRYTHQMVYSPKSNSHFIFGGHPGDAAQDDKRLDDFWELKLAK
jgi:ribosomal protein S17E